MGGVILARSYAINCLRVPGCYSSCNESGQVHTHASLIRQCDSVMAKEKSCLALAAGKDRRFSHVDSTDSVV